jgi:hypothetical protein
MGEELPVIQPEQRRTGEKTFLQADLRVLILSLTRKIDPMRWHSTSAIARHSP